MEFRTGDEAAMGLEFTDTDTAEGATKARPAAKAKHSGQAMTMDRKDGSEGLVVEQAAAEDALDSYEVELRKSGKHLRMEAGMVLLDVLLEQGCDLDYSCREGVCGSCEVKVLEGEVDHRDGVLTKAERAANQSMMVCVSGCRSRRLVLDL